MVRVLVSSVSIKVVTVVTGMGSLAALEPRSLHSAVHLGGRTGQVRLAIFKTSKQNSAARSHSEGCCLIQPLVYS